MAGDIERRSYDGEISGIRKSIDTLVDNSTKTSLHVERISTLQKVYVEEIKTCREETIAHGKAIASMKTTQKITGVIASIGTATGLGFIVRWYFKTH